jgi:hypothetical protein
MTTCTPLEGFVRDYVEGVGGVWDEVEPQVYDLLLPLRQDLRAWQGETLRVTFDPEALPDHPGSQLASYGTPLVERMLSDAMERGRFACLYFLGLNLAPHDLPGRARKSLTLAAGLELDVGRVRALHFAQALFWFQAGFVSDQKEQDVLAASVDLHYGRQVRHREKLLDASRLAEQAARRLPEAPRLSLAAAYPLARAEVLRSLVPMAHARERELRDRLGRQVTRMKRYYGDLRSEVAQGARRGKEDEEAERKQNARLQGIANEERLRINELRQKNSLHVHLRLLNILVVQQPKLLLYCRLSAAKRAAGKRASADLQLIWDPLLDALEAAPCPACGRPTFALNTNRQGAVHCTGCVLGHQE